MIRTLKDATSQMVQNAILEARHNLGSGSGMVFTLLVVTDLQNYDSAMDACIAAGREHPSRIILVTDGSAQASRLDAEVHIGEDVPGEIIALRFHGELQQHRDSVLLPLLLPDSPTVVWWPGSSPDSLVDDPVGSLGSRRISDSMGARHPIRALETRASNFQPGDSDLTWTRITPWRALLAGSLDQHEARVNQVVVSAAENNAAGMLLAAWLENRLGCVVDLVLSDGPGITSVRMSTDLGDISVQRTDGMMALYEAPGTPARKVALRRREITALLAEELRRLDPDEVLNETARQLLTRCEQGRGRPKPLDLSHMGAGELQED